MPVTKSAKRALRGSNKKLQVNKLIVASLEASIRVAKKIKSQASIVKAVSLADRAAKKGVVHKNKAARIKSQLSKLLSKTKVEPKSEASKKKASKSLRK